MSMANEVDEGEEMKKKRKKDESRAGNRFSHERAAPPEANFTSELFSISKQSFNRCNSLAPLHNILFDSSFNHTKRLIQHSSISLQSQIFLFTLFIMATAVAASAMSATNKPSATTHPYTCNTCQVAFKGSELQRGHMQSDWQ